MGSGASSVNLYLDSGNKKNFRISNIQTNQDAHTELQKIYQVMMKIDGDSVKKTMKAVEWSSLILELEAAGVKEPDLKLQLAEAKALITKCRSAAVKFQGSQKIGASKKTKGKGNPKAKGKKARAKGASKPKGKVTRDQQAENDAGPNLESKAENENTNAEVPDIVVSDPWAAFRSPYGGKLSPAEEWTKLKEGLSVLRFAPDQVSALCSEDLKLSGTNLDALISNAENTAGSSQEETQLEAPLSTNESGVCDKLSLQGCGLSALEISPATRCNFVSLELSGNMLSKSFGEVLQPNFLRELVLAGNHLDEVPDLTFFPKLLSLDLSYNPIEVISQSDFPEVLSSRLHFLNLESTGLSTFRAVENTKESILKNFRFLQVLIISNNQIEEIESLEVICRSNFPKLSELYVDRNPFCQKEAYVETLLKCARQFSTMKKLNGSSFEAAIAVGDDALRSAIQRSLDVLSQHASSGESCSCIEGNPCAVPDNCKNWACRFEVAKRVREDKYDNVF